MKRIIFFIFLSLAMVSVSISMLTHGETHANQDVVAKEITPFVYCCLAHKGPFSEIENVIKQLMQQSQNQNVFPAGPILGIYYNSPDQVSPEELKWEMGFPITAQTPVQSPLEKKEWNHTPVASALHVGPYEKTGETIIKIMKWMEANGYIIAGPVLERYLDAAPSSVKPEKLRTEIWIPCKKK